MNTKRTYIALAHKNAHRITEALLTCLSILVHEGIQRLHLPMPGVLVLSLIWLGCTNYLKPRLQAGVRALTRSPDHER